MATATGFSSGGSPATITDENRRWVVVGICFTKVLTSALRDVLAKEMPKWYKSLLPPPHEIDKQTFRKHMKSPPYSTFKFNYGSINNNFANHKSSVRNYDYCVKDPESLAKLFMKQFMASFTGFDQTMDTSAALSVVAEARPFHGVSVTAKKIRSDVRNAWAHCDFAHWTDDNYQAALTDIETLLNTINLTAVEKKKKLDDLDGWKKKGIALCFGQPVDSELLKLVKTEVGELRESVKLWKEDVEINQGKVLSVLETIEKSINEEIQDLKKGLHHIQQEVKRLNEQHRESEFVRRDMKQYVEAVKNSIEQLELKMEEISGEKDEELSSTENEDGSVSVVDGSVHDDSQVNPQDTTSLSYLEVTQLSLKIVTVWRVIAGLANLDRNEVEIVIHDHINYPGPRNKAAQILVLISSRPNFSRKKLGKILEEAGMWSLVDDLLKGTFYHDA